MSDAGLFIAGVGVTIVVALAMGILVWGLIMERQQNRQDSESKRT